VFAKTLDFQPVDVAVYAVTSVDGQYIATDKSLSCTSNGIFIGCAGPDKTSTRKDAEQIRLRLSEPHGQRIPCLADIDGKPGLVCRRL